MSKLDDKIDARVKLNGTGKEFEKSFIVCKRYSKVMNKAILGQASKEEITAAVTEMQSSLEIIKHINSLSTETVNEGVLEYFGLGTPAEAKTESTKEITGKKTGKK